MEEIKDSTEYRSMTEEIDILTQRIAANSEGNATVLRAQRTTLYNKRNSLIKNELRKLQLQQKVDYETDKAPHDETDWHKGHFNRIKHMLPPERLRLATTMMAQASPRSHTWIQAIEDLICLRKSDCKVAYQRGLQPVDGFCPISSCRQEISRYETFKFGVSLIANKSLAIVYQLRNGGTMSTDVIELYTLDCIALPNSVSCAMNGLQASLNG